MMADDVEDKTLADVPIRSLGKGRAPKGTGRRYASLIVLEGKEIGREFRLTKMQSVIGRDMGAAICIVGDKSISRRHALLKLKYDPERKATDYLLTDLESTNHTFVNEEEISVRSLKDGDKVRVGDTVLKFMLQDEFDAKFHEEIQRRINYDSLTGLLTRDSFELALDFELDRLRKSGLSLAVLMMDIDHFKDVNDTRGHQAGSFVLSEVGRLIAENLRAFDVSGRFGGEEFFAYLTEVDREGARLAGERVREAIGGHEFRFKEQSIRITISIGIALFPDDGDSVETLIARADKALYRAKNSGRDRVTLSDPALDA